MKLSGSKTFGARAFVLAVRQAENTAEQVMFFVVPLLFSAVVIICIYESTNAKKSSCLKTMSAFPRS